MQNYGESYTFLLDKFKEMEEILKYLIKINLKHNLIVEGGSRFFNRGSLIEIKEFSASGAHLDFLTMQYEYPQVDDLYKENTRAKFRNFLDKNVCSEHIDLIMKDVDISADVRNKVNKSYQFGNKALENRKVVITYYIR